MYEQFGKDVTQEQIRAFLRQKANVDISKAQKLAENIDTIYKKVSNYIILAKKVCFSTCFCVEQFKNNVYIKAYDMINMSKFER